MSEWSICGLKVKLFSTSTFGFRCLIDPNVALFKMKMKHLKENNESARTPWLVPKYIYQVNRKTFSNNIYI